MLQIATIRFTFNLTSEYLTKTRFFYVENSRCYFGSVKWSSLPTDLRKNFGFDLFKTTIWKWKPVGCSLRLGKNYLMGFGSIDVSS